MYEWYFILFLAGMAAFAFSTLSGGGGALLLLPVTEAVVGATGTAPVVQLATFIGRPVRLVLFWKDIDWRVVKRYLPAAMVGAVLGAWLFSRMDSRLIKIVLGLFLVSTILQYCFGKKERSFPVPLWVFTPLGLIVALTSAIIGGMGPILNPFYLNYGLDKEKLIATKTANSFFVGIVQISSYSFFGALSGSLWGYGLAMGLGTALGNWLGKKLLRRLSSIAFRRLVIAVMVLSGVWMIVRAIN